MTFASVIATPAPIAADPPLAEPSAFETAAAISEDVRVSAPPLATTTPPGSVAIAESVAIVTATAAATEIGPPEVDAAGVEAELEPAPPAAEECVPAFVRSPFTWPVTSPPGGGLLDVPPVDAFAEPFDVAVPVAEKDAAPPTVSERFVVAVTAFVASMTETDAPTAAPEAAADPVADVVADAVCVAETTSAPPTVVAEPMPIDASVVIVERITATDGTIATLPPAAPVTDVAVAVSASVACSMRLWPLKTEPSPSAACVVSVTIVSETDAPIPVPAPAVAFDEDVVPAVALNVASPDAFASVPVSVAFVETVAIVSPSEPATEKSAAAPEMPSLE